MAIHVKKVVIAGGGTAGWIAAVALSKQLGSLLDITLVESDQIGTVGVGEASIPPMRSFHQLNGIDEQAFMKATQATFKLGIAFDNWARVGDHYLHSFGKTGKETWLGGFQHFWMRAHEQGVASEFGDYCLEFQAAKAERFSNQGDTQINYAYHLDATRYARFLRTLSEKQGVKRVEGKIQHVLQNPDSGHIQALQLESGERVEGDLFIDCTGFRGLLIEQTLKTGYEDWSHWLACDSAVAVQTESTEPAVPFTRSTAHDCGWQWKIPLQHRVGNGRVYCSHHVSDDQAREDLLKGVTGAPLTEPRLIKYRTGRRRKVWNKNCVALGLASGFVEPLESTSIHLIMMGVTRLMQQFPFGGITSSQVDQYNRVAQDEIEKIRDFIILHYHLTERSDSDFWRFCGNMEIPDTLKHRMALFRDNAQAYQADGELFRIDSWVQVMLGQRLMPRSYHHVSEMLGDAQLKQFLTEFKASLAQTVEKMPSHQQFVDQYCPAD